MKTGNKRLIALLCAVLILVGLVGCKAEPEPVQVQASDFFANFEETLRPIAADFEITELPPIELDDGTMYRSISLQDGLLGDLYHLRMYYDADGPLEMIIVEGEKDKYTNFTLAILSIYAYQAMGFEVTDADAFYENFALLTPEPSGLKEIKPGLTAHAHTYDDSITFAIMYTD